MAGCVSQARYIVSFTRRLAALAAVLALSVGNVAVCAGWQPTAEARMACCMSDMNCSMHKPDGHDHGATSDVSQTQADLCCASSSERRESPTATSTVASSGVIALVPAAVLSLSMIQPPAQQWRALVPLRGSPVPRHLLLSVLLV